MILLDFIETLPVDDPAQAQAKEWARRVRELTARGDALLLEAKGLFNADKLEEMDQVLEAHDKVLAELAEICHRQGDFMRRLHTAPGRMQ